MSLLDTANNLPSIYFRSKQISADYLVINGFYLKKVLLVAMGDGDM